MAMTGTARQLDLTEVERGRHDEEEGSVAELATRLAQEGVGLVAVELRRLSAEVRRRRRYAGRTAAALLLGAACTSVGTMTLAGAAVLYLGRVWRDYAAAAAATGVLLLLAAVSAGWVLRSFARRIARADTAGEPEQRSTGHG